MKKLILLLLFFTPSALAQEQEPVFYRASGQELSIVLKDIAEGFGLDAHIASLPSHTIEGQFNPLRADVFFAELAARYQFDWFIHENRLYITPPSAREKTRFSFSDRTLREEFYMQFNAGLVRAGTRFSLQQQESDNDLTLEAPSVFLALARKFYRRYQSSHAIPTPGDDKEGVMIFHLKHAWAADKTHHFANGSWTVPGIASLLARLAGKAGETSANKPPSSLQPMREAGQGKSASKTKAAAPDTSLPVILPDPRINAVLIRDKRDKQIYYQTLIARLDRAQKLVQIEAMIIDVAKNRISDLGINWQGTRGRDSAGFGAPPGTGAAGDLTLAFGTGQAGESLISDLSSFMARIRLLATKGESRIVSRPSIMTMDNLEAVINMSEKFYVRVEGNEDASLVPVESGTTLRVTPHIISNHEGGKKSGTDRIRLMVAIEDGTLDDSESARVDGLPRVQQHHVQTQAVIDENASLLLGGHVHSITSRSRFFVPILGQIPILGWAFSNDQIIRREFVRLFIIKPRIHENRLAATAPINNNSADKNDHE